MENETRAARRRGTRDTSGTSSQVEVPAENASESGSGFTGLDATNEGSASSSEEPATIAVPLASPESTVTTSEPTTVTIASVSSPAERPPVTLFYDGAESVNVWVLVGRT